VTAVGNLKRHLIAGFAEFVALIAGTWYMVTHLVDRRATFINGLVFGAVVLASAYVSSLRLRSTEERTKRVNFMHMAGAALLAVATALRSWEVSEMMQALLGYINGELFVVLAITMASVAAKTRTGATQHEVRQR